MKYVIIGNGPAAVTAAETIRRVDDAGEITLLSKEDEFTYSRPLISYLLCGKTDETRMRYKRTVSSTPMTSCCWRRARSRLCRRFRGWKA